MLLSDFLRHVLGATGTHVGCEHGVCGCCTVLIDGTAVRSCLTLAVQAEGRAVTTVESLADGERQAQRAAAGVPEQSRAAMRVLHPRHPDVVHRFPRAQSPIRPKPRWSRCSAGISAAAPAMPASSRPCSKPPAAASRAAGKASKRSQQGGDAMADVFGKHAPKIPYQPIADLLAQYARRDAAKLAIVDLDQGELDQLRRARAGGDRHRRGAQAAGRRAKAAACCCSPTRRWKSF